MHQAVLWRGYLIFPSLQVQIQKYASRDGPLFFEEAWKSLSNFVAWHFWFTDRLCMNSFLGG